MSPVVPCGFSRAIWIAQTGLDMPRIGETLSRERRNEINIDWTLIAVIIAGVAAIGSSAFLAGGIRQSVKDLEMRLTRVEIRLDDLSKGVSRLTGMFETFIAMRSNNQAAPKVDGKSDE